MAESDEDSDTSGKKSPSFWDSWTFFAIFLIAIVILRFFVFEPFKIPSGSMEPTLIGHEDYGDRILTNKMAYVPLWQVLAAAGGLAALIVAACVGGRVWKRPKLLVTFGLMLLAVIAGFSTALMRGAMAGEPRRLDVVVFSYDPAWMGKHDTPKNYIKRLVGLPGDTLVVSGGDLFLRDKVTLKDEIIRKWEYDPELQENLWQPVARCIFREKPVPEIEDANDPIEKIKRDAVVLDNSAAMPWTVEGGTCKREIGKRDKHWGLTISGECALSYAPPIRNVYCKMGRWPFKHSACPMAHLPAINGIRDSRETIENIRPYIASTWTGVRCPNCGQSLSPLVRDLKDVPEGQPKIVPDFDWSPINAGGKSNDKSDNGEEKAPPDYGDVSAARGTPFFYGGHSKENEVGDLKIEVEIELLSGGSAMQIQVGSDRHSALWTIFLGTPHSATGLDLPQPAPGSHSIGEGLFASSLDTGSKHTVSLAYVDGTVMASLDGRALEPKKISGVAPLGDAKMKHVASVRFSKGTTVRITRLDLYHDLYYTTSLDNSFGQDPVARDRDGNPIRDTKRTWKDGLFIAEIPKFNPMAPESDMNRDMFMVMGDNSPSSQDSRVWGFVPRENFVGRGTLVWWPPSRWRVLH